MQARLWCVCAQFTAGTFPLPRPLAHYRSVAGAAASVSDTMQQYCVIIHILFNAAPAAWKAARCSSMWRCWLSAEAPRQRVLIDRFHLTHPHPAKPYPLSAMTELLCAVGVVPTRVYPKSGRISALAGRQGRLRACT